MPVPEWNTCGFVTDKFVASTRRAFVSWLYCRLHKNGVNGTEAEKYVTTGRLTLGKPAHLRHSPRKWSKSLSCKHFQPSYERCMWAVTNDDFSTTKNKVCSWLTCAKAYSIRAPNTNPLNLLNWFYNTYVSHKEPSVNTHQITHYNFTLTHLDYMVFRCAIPRDVSFNFQKVSF